MSRTAQTLMLVLSLLACTGEAAAQPYVQRPCAGSAPKFVDRLQPLWYRRFWTGECQGLPALGCRGGKPYWNDVVHTLVARAPPAQRLQVAQRTCKLGRQIGFEWTRPSKVRRIDTNDLWTLNATLEKAKDVPTGLAAVEAKVRGKVGG